MRVIAVVFFTFIGFVCIDREISAQQSPPANFDLAKAASGVKQIIGHRGSCADRPENTIASYHRAIEAGATAIEIDVRRTKDGALVSLHDADVQRTTDGKGPVSGMTLTELHKLDAGSWFDPKFQNERVPAVREILKLARGKIDVLLDLKEQGEPYAIQVIAEIRTFGEPKRIIVGVRSVEQATLFRKLLPEARQIGLIPRPETIDAFAAAKVEMIRLWPKWLTDETLVARTRHHKLGLHLNSVLGTDDEIRHLLRHSPDSLSSDDPAQLIQSLKKFAGRNDRE